MEKKLYHDIFAWDHDFDILSRYSKKIKKKLKNRGYKAFLIRRLNPSFSTVAKGTMSLARWYVIASVTSLHRLLDFSYGVPFWNAWVRVVCFGFSTEALAIVDGVGVRSRLLTGGGALAIVDGGCARDCWRRGGGRSRLLTGGIHYHNAAGS